MSKTFRKQIFCNELFPDRNKSVNRYVDLEIIGGKNIPDDFREFSDILKTIFKQFNDHEHNNLQFSKNPEKERTSIGKESLSCHFNKNFKYRLIPDNETFYDLKKSKQYKKFFNHIKFGLLNEFNLIDFPMEKIAEEFISFEPYFDENVFVDMKHKDLLVSFLYNNRPALNQFLEPRLHNSFIYKNDEQKLLQTIETQNTQIRDYLSTHPNIGKLVSEIRNFNNNNTQTSFSQIAMR